jgi:hypothetical protein
MMVIRLVAMINATREHKNLATLTGIRQMINYVEHKWT